MKTATAVGSIRTPKKRGLTLPKVEVVPQKPSIPEVPVYGREELVRMITGNYDPKIHWTTLGNEAPVAIVKKDMYRLHGAIGTFRANRVQYDRGSFTYYKKAFDKIDEAVMNSNFEAFKEGCGELIGLLGWD